MIYSHYTYGAGYDWIFGVSAGIKPLEDGAGYRHIPISPNPDKRIGFLKASIDTRLGRLSSHWYYKDDRVYYEFEVPAGAVAEIELPDGTHHSVGGGRYMYVV